MGDYNNEPAYLLDHLTEQRSDVAVPRPCPICGHELAPRIIRLRDWLLHPFASLQHRRFDRGYPAWHMLLNHGQSTALHELSPSTVADWNAP